MSFEERGCSITVLKKTKYSVIQFELKYLTNHLIVYHYLHLYFLIENSFLILVIIMSTLALLLWSAVMISTVAKLGNYNTQKDLQISQLIASREWNVDIKRNKKIEKPTFSALKS